MREIVEAGEALNLEVREDTPGRWLVGGYELDAPMTEDNPGGSWDLYIGVVIPGVWRTANGDGWPDEFDVNLLGTYPTLAEALEALSASHAAALADAEAEARAFEQAHEEGWQ